MINLTRTARMLAAAALLAFAFPTAAKAVPVLWTLADVEFLDGGTASGSFVYDAALNAYSAIDITTTAGSARSGAHYTLLSLGFPVLPDVVVFVEEGTGADQTGADRFMIVFPTALTDAGGILDFPTGLEETCADPACSSAEGTLRLSFTGTLTGTPLAEEVPEPSALALLGGGLLALGAARRRRHAGAR